MAQSKLKAPVEKIKAIGDLFRRARDSLTIPDEGPQSVTCPFCTRKERLQTFDKLEAGKHICLGGEKFKRNIGNKQFAWYTHHAIVEKVEVISPSTANLTLIHFISTPFDSTNKIQRTVETKNLLYDEIYIVHYRHPVNPPEKVLERARFLLEDGEKVVYSGLERNCEHLCNLCCAGSDDSLQVHDGLRLMLQDILTAVGAVGAKMLRVVLRLTLMSLDDLSKIAVAEIAVPWGILSGLTVIQLIYCVYQHIQYNKRLKKGTMCYSCCTKMKKDLWLKFGAFCVLQVGGLGLLSVVASAVTSQGILLGVMSVFGIISIALVWAIPKVRQKICAPFQGRFLRKDALSDIFPGDVIKISKRTRSFHGIVTYVKASKDCATKGRIKLIYYKKHRNRFSRPVIVEEEDVYDLKKVKIEQLDYSSYKCYDARTVIRRARKRLGEKKYGLLTNRSCHFCHWAIVNEDEAGELEDVAMSDKQMMFLRSLQIGESIKLQSIQIDHRRSRVPATTTMGKHWARIRDDVKPGQVVGLGFFWRKAICTGVSWSEEAASKLSVSIVHYGKRGKVNEESLDIDLNEEDIWIYRCHPLYRYSKDQVIQRARDRIGQGGYNLFTNRSSHLVAEIVEKHIDERVDDLQKIKTGDVIKFYYWSFKHAAVVSMVQPEERKESLTQKKPTGTITVIHYALDNLFGTRYVKEETVRFNLENDSVYLKKYDGFVTYPRKQVVMRAQSRKGEQRFSALQNTSSDFVHWCKVVQTPHLVALSQPSSLQDQSVMEQRIVIPLVGKQTYKHFQIAQVHSWGELKPGSIISFKYYLIWHEGILTEVDKERKEMKVIHYGTRHIFATRTIVEDTLQCDTAYNHLWLYRCDPRRCKKPDEIIDCARKRLGEKNWKKGNRSWDFCVDCIMKKRRKSGEAFLNSLDNSDK